MLAYGHDRVAPTARIEAIEQTGDHFAGQGPVLWNELEEYAKFFARAAKISAPFEPITPQQVQLRSPTYFVDHYFDLDEELLSFVEGYPIIVTRRSPTASRPPANYRLVYENKYYLGWRRSSTPQILHASARAAAVLAVRNGRLHRAGADRRRRSRRHGADRRERTRTGGVQPSLRYAPLALLAGRSGAGGRG